MTSLSPGGTIDSPPHPDATSVLARCLVKVLEREGIPMFVALQDARPGAAAVSGSEAAHLLEGRRLAELFDHYRDGLAGSAPSRGDDDPTGASALIDILVVLSDQHLRAPGESAT